MPSDQTAYTRALLDAAKRFDRLEADTMRDMVNVLEATRQRLAASLLLDVSDFETHRLGELKASTERLIDQLDAELAAALRERLGQAYQMGSQAAISPLEAVGLQAAFNQIDLAQLNAVMGFSADLVQRISEPLRGKINTHLMLSVLGEQSPYDAMRAITKELRSLGKAYDMRWGRLKRKDVTQGVAARAEAIVRTEMTRVYNLGHYSTLLQTAKQMPGVLKRWMATGDERTRPSHIAAHRDSFDKPIKPEERFSNGLLFPGDPGAPPEETVNCRCRLIVVHEELGVTRTPMDNDVLGMPEPQVGPPRRPISGTEAAYKQEVNDVRAAYNEALRTGNTAEAEGIKPYLDEIERIYADERDVNQALWDRFEIGPEEATANHWQRLAESLQVEGYDLYKKYSREGIQLSVQEQRAAKYSGYADVGGKVVQIKQGRFSVREAQRIEGQMWSKAKDKISDAYGQLLAKAGYRPADIAKANFEQRARLLSELGEKQITTTRSGNVSRIDDVAPEARQRVVTRVDYDLASTCALAAYEPLATPGLDAYRKMQLADMILSTR